MYLHLNYEQELKWKEQNPLQRMKHEQWEDSASEETGISLLIKVLGGLWAHISFEKDLIEIFNQTDIRVEFETKLSFQIGQHSRFLVIINREM